MDNDAAKLLTSEFVNLHDDLNRFWTEQRTQNAAILQSLGELAARINQLTSRLGEFQEQNKEELHTMAQELDALTAEVTRNTSVDESAIALLNGLAAKIEQLKTDPAALQALANSMRTSSDNLAAAVVANTPAEDGGGDTGGGGNPPV